MSHEYSLLKIEDLSVGTNIFDRVTLTLEFDLLFKSLNLANNFWTVSASQEYSLWQTFAQVLKMFKPCYIDFGVLPIFFFKLSAKNVCISGATPLIFHMSILSVSTNIFDTMTLFLSIFWHYFFKKRNEHIRRNHLANKGDGSKIWPGVKQWSHNELEAMKETFYGRRTRTTIVSTGYVYGEVKIRSFENKCYLF